MPHRGPTSRPALFVMLSVVASFAASASTVRAANECIVKPNSQPPQGQHWYYQTDGESKRQCWYLGPQRDAVRKSAAERLKPSEPDAHATTAALARGANLTQQQREALFRRFVEWRRSHPAQPAQ